MEMTTLTELSHHISDRQQVFPGHPSVRIKNWKTLSANGRSVQEISLGNHTGTHMDTPSHFFKEGACITAIPPERLFGEALVLDYTEKRRGDKITQSDLVDKNVTFPRKAIVLLNTGWDRLFRNKEYLLDYPCLSLDAAEYLADGKINIIGMDFPSPGPVGQEGDEIHKLLLQNDILLIESMKNLDNVKTKDKILAAPLAVKNCSGSPCRVFAFPEER